MERCISLAKLVDNLLGSSEKNKLGHKRVHIKEKCAKVCSHIQQCLCKVVNGHFTSDVKVFDSSSVTPYNSRTIKALEAKHAYKLHPSIVTTLYSKAPLVAEVYTIFRCIKSFLKRISLGRDDLRAQQVLDGVVCRRFSCS